MLTGAQGRDNPPSGTGTRCGIRRTPCGVISPLHRRRPRVAPTGTGPIRGRPERRTMGISTAPGMTSEEIAALSRAHTVFSWSVQGQVDPIAIDRAEGVYLYTPEGKRILDFNSQLMSVNIGHGDRRVIDAITEQATKLQYVQPAFATEPRARLGAKLAEILPGDL